MAAEIFSPERLQLARQRRGLFIQELAGRIVATSKTVARWEKGERTPSDEYVSRLSAALNFPREYFYGDAPPMLKAAAFRSLARMTARQRDTALAAGSQAVALDDWISAQFRRPAPNVPHLRGYSPEEAALGLRAIWGLGYKPIRNVVHRLEANGVRVYSLVHDGGEIDAFSEWHGETPFIFLNTIKTAERSRMDTSHELGHLILHAYRNGGSSKAEEDEAHAFAMSFLMPREPFVASAPRHVTLSTVVEAKKKWGVSALAYVRRLRQLDRITQWHYSSLSIEIKSRYPSSEPGPEQERETSQMLAKVLSASSRKEIAKHLRIHLHDLDEITFGLTLTPVRGSIRPASTPPPKPFKIELVRDG